MRRLLTYAAFVCLLAANTFAQERAPDDRTGKPTTPKEAATAVEKKMPQSDDPPAAVCPAQIIKTPYLSSGGLLSRRSELHIEIRNLTDAPIKSVGIQLDIVDRIRRVARDRLFIEVFDWGFGDRSIKPSKSKLFTVPVEYVLPQGAGDGYGTYWCIDNCAVINVVHFKNGGTWERKGWRDEPNPNR